MDIISLKIKDTMYYIVCFLNQSIQKITFLLYQLLMNFYEFL